MVNSIYIIIAVVAISLQHICKKAYNEKMFGKAVIIFSALSSLTAAIFFIFQVKLPVSIDIKILPYSVLFALGYGSAVLFSVLAIGCGSLSLTSLITSYSLIIPTLYGLVFKGDKISGFLIIGLILLMISLFLVNFVKGDKGTAKINVKWIIFVSIAFLGNGLCSAVQNAQVEAFGGKYKSEFMSIALLLVFLVLMIVSFTSERNHLKSTVQKGILPIIICGAANGLVNLVIMLLSARMEASVMYPLVSAGSIILTYLISCFWYKEKLSLMQNIGFVLGVASVVFLNL